MQRVYYVFVNKKLFEDQVYVTVSLLLYITVHIC